MIRIERDGEVLEIEEQLPLLPLRDVVMFPYMLTPLLIGRETSLRALDEAMDRDKPLLICAQRDPEVDTPQEEDIYPVGVVCQLIQTLRLPDGTVRALVEGLVRARIKRFIGGQDFLSVEVEVFQERPSDSLESRARMRHVLSLFNDYVRLHRQIPDEILDSVNNIEFPLQLTDTIAAHIIHKVEVKQRLLEISDLDQRLDELARVLISENEILEMEQKIDNEVRSRMEKGQKELYLHEQMRAIKEELGEIDETLSEIEQLRGRIEQAQMPKEVEEKALAELDKLSKMHILSPESTVVRNYLDWLISMPWEERTQDNLDIEEARRILDEDHYGLKKPKERILEYLAVIKLVQRIKGPILCFVGPPGVGKTSLAKSIARALGRRFVRVSLGGIRDEAEIRGHRRTYVGSMPGRIIQSIRKAKSKNPVFLLDEVDKIGVDFRGDPAAALLEVLDPEQNCAFSDHYLDVDFDLSEVLFITTANVAHSISPTLLDRMEVIHLPGYLEHEKLEIAKRFLIPKQLKEHGLKESHLKISDSAITRITRNYAQEAGVRNLEREIATICRKVARKVVDGETSDGAVRVDTRSLHNFLGVPRYREKRVERIDGVGIATGLAWTEVGGEILNIEVTLMEGRGRLILTGKLGDVMQESAQAALSYTRARARDLNIDPRFYRNMDIHIHVPEGAIPKDGPSSGITMAAALISALTQKPVRRNVAMTGEITLRGNVLPIGGLTEKALAAQRAGIQTVILPRDNEKDLGELPSQVKRHLEFKLVDHMDQVLALALKDIH